MASQVDSREGTVTLDYDNLIIKGPTTFQKSVNYATTQTFTNQVNFDGPVAMNAVTQFNGNATFLGLMINQTYPRIYTTKGQIYAYSHSAAANIPLTSQTIIQDTFTGGFPVLSLSDYFTVADEGTITFRDNGIYASVEATILSPSFTTSGALSLFQLVHTTANGTISEQDVLITPGASAPYPTTVSLKGRFLCQNNDSVVITVTSTVNLTLTLTYRILVDKPGL